MKVDALLLDKIMQAIRNTLTHRNGWHMSAATEEEIRRAIAFELEDAD